MMSLTFLPPATRRHGKDIVFSVLGQKEMLFEKEKHSALDHFDPQQIDFSLKLEAILVSSQKLKGKIPINFSVELIGRWYHCCN